MKKLGIRISNKPNAKYGLNDLIRTLLCMSENNHFFRSATNKLLQAASLQKDGSTTKKPPSTEWVLGKLKEVGLEKTDKWCRHTPSEISKMAMAAGMIKKGDTVAIDITDREYYGKGLKDYIRKSKPKNGTSKFVSHIMMQSIGHDFDIPLDCMDVPPGINQYTYVRKMLKRLDRIGLSPSRVLADRGFFSVEGINCLKERGREFVMPAVKNARIKRAIEEYDKNKRDPVSGFAIRDSNGKKAKFRLLIVKKEKWDEKAEITDRYVAFATNIEHLSDAKLVESLPEQYRKRWMIETGFRMIKSCMGRTCSNNYPVKIFLFYFAMLLYSSWMLLKFEDAHNGSFAGGDAFTLVMFMSCLTTMADRVVIDGDYHLECVK